MTTPAYRELHREELAAKQRVYAAAHVAERQEYARTWYLAHREDRCAQVRRYVENNRDLVSERRKGYATTGRATRRAWVEANAERLREYSRGYKAAHRVRRPRVYLHPNKREAKHERALARRAQWDATFDQRQVHRLQLIKDWQAAHPERVKFYQQRNSQARRAVKRGVFAQKIDRFAVYARDKGICGICGKVVARLNFHLDHVVPIYAGGTHEYLNVRTTHPTCNLSRPRPGITEYRGIGA